MGFAREATSRPAAAPESHASLRADLAAGWRALREHPDTLPLVGADFVSSAIYGALTVLFVLLGQKLGLGAVGYGYLLSALGVGGVLAANLANRAAASDRPRRALIAAVAAVGLPLVTLALTGSTAVALVLAACIGAGTMTTEVVAETTLQRTLDDAVVARAYGLVVPACVAGIAGGALLAAPLVALLGLDITLALTGAAVGVVQAGLLRPGRWVAPLLGALGGLVANLLFVGVGILAGQEQLRTAHTFVVLGFAVLYDALIAAFVFPLAAWATRPGAIRSTFRNWDYPIRRQIFSGFRCAQDA